jgi:hypothetical protein
MLSLKMMQKSLDDIVSYYIHISPKEFYKVYEECDFKTQERIRSMINIKKDEKETESKKINNMIEEKRMSVMMSEKAFCDHVQSLNMKELVVCNFRILPKTPMDRKLYDESTEIVEYDSDTNTMKHIQTIKDEGNSIWTMFTATSHSGQFKIDPNLNWKQKVNFFQWVNKVLLKYGSNHSKITLYQSVESDCEPVSIYPISQAEYMKSNITLIHCEKMKEFLNTNESIYGIRSISIHPLQYVMELDENENLQTILSNHIDNIFIQYEQTYVNTISWKTKTWLECLQEIDKTYGTSELWLRIFAKNCHSKCIINQLDDKGLSTYFVEQLHTFSDIAEQEWNESVCRYEENQRDFFDSKKN